MEGITGDHMRRISLDDPNRGGIIGQPSILALTSNYKDTSPVKRGNYVLDVLLGTPPPPPPPNAGVLSEEVADMRNLSFREKLEMHSQNETCRACHRRIDPIGFSLEKLRTTSAAGARRMTSAGGCKIRPRPTRPSSSRPRPAPTRSSVTSRTSAGRSPPTECCPMGTSFTGPAGLKQALLDTRHDDLVRQTVSKMLAYALGRQLEYYDEPGPSGRSLPGSRRMTIASRPCCRRSSKAIRSNTRSTRRSPTDEVSPTVQTHGAPGPGSHRGAAAARRDADLCRRAPVEWGRRPRAASTAWRILYFPNGIPRGIWYPEETGPTGRLLKLNEWMSPLEPFKDDILIPSNILDPGRERPCERAADLAHGAEVRLAGR